LEELSTGEIEGLLERGWRNIIVPLGAMEQHGPGLPLCVDVLHGRRTALLAAERLDRTLVAPAVQLGYSVEHLSFAGTISIREETLHMLVQDIVRSLSRSGFTFIYFWYGHGGDFAVVEPLIAEYQAKSSTVTVTAPRDVAAYVEETWDRYPQTVGIDLSVSGSHAGEFEASMTLAIRDDLVRRDLLAAGSPSALREVEETMMRDGIDAVSPNGVLGDQRPADGARGERYLAVLADYLVRDFTRQHGELHG
jgi:creatinine amidohydrolase